MRVVQDRRIDAELEEFLIIREADRLDAIAEILPERLNIRRAWKAPGHAHDCDI